VRHGAPLIRLDTAAIAQRVERLPAVRSASVRTSYPGTVTIQVVERTPVGYLETGSTFTLVDGSGVRYRTVPGRPARLPLFAIPTGEQSTSATAAVAVVAGDLPAGLLGRITSIQAFDATAITLLLTDHRVVRWGTVARSADKAQLLPTLLLQPGTQFDLTNPDQVVVR
jgi:cell division protein FtsQ